MLVISSREFRQNQRLYFDKVDKGEQIIVQRGKDKSYILTPVSEDDLYFSAAMIKRIKKSIKQAEFESKDSNSRNCNCACRHRAFACFVFSSYRLESFDYNSLLVYYGSSISPLSPSTNFQKGPPAQSIYIRISSVLRHYGCYDL